MPNLIHDSKYQFNSKHGRKQLETGNNIDGDGKLEAQKRGKPS